MSKVTRWYVAMLILASSIGLYWWADWPGRPSLVSSSSRPLPSEATHSSTARDFIEQTASMGEASVTKVLESATRMKSLEELLDQSRRLAVAADEMDVDTFKSLAIDLLQSPDAILALIEACAAGATGEEDHEAVFALVRLAILSYAAERETDFYGEGFDPTPFFDSLTGLLALIPDQYANALLQSLRTSNALDGTYLNTLYELLSIEELEVEAAKTFVAISMNSETVDFPTIEAFLASRDVEARTGALEVLLAREPDYFLPVAERFFVELPRGAIDRSRIASTIARTTRAEVALPALVRLVRADTEAPALHGAFAILRETASPALFDDAYLAERDPTVRSFLLMSAGTDADLLGFAVKQDQHPGVRGQALLLLATLKPDLDTGLLIRDALRFRSTSEAGAISAAKNYGSKADEELLASRVGADIAAALRSLATREGISERSRRRALEVAALYPGSNTSQP